MITEAIKKVISGDDLTASEAEAAMNDIMSGNATDAQIGSFITALRMKGEVKDEVLGFAKAMRSNALRIETDGEVLDTCGTGGDMSCTFNISTAAAFVAAGAGAKVAKHGNRSVSSKCGSADVLEALNVNLSLSPQQIGECLNTTGIAFLFAQALHPAMKYAAGPRRELGVRTVFNILGPLSNPAGAKYQLLGVFDSGLTDLMASVLKELGSKRAYVVHGMAGLDEISLEGETKITELSNNEIKTYFVTPEEYGLRSGKIDEIKGGSAEDNAETMNKLFEGNLSGPINDIVLLNSSFALLAYGTVSGVDEGLKKAEESLIKGYAADKLKQLTELTNRLAD